MIYFEFVENPFVSVLFGNSSRGNHRLRRRNNFNLKSSSSFEPPIQVCTMDHLSKQSYSQTWGRMELSQSLSYSQTPSPWEHGVSGVHFLKLQIKIQDEWLFEITEGGCPLFSFLFIKTKLTECSNHPPDPKVLRFFQTVFGNYYFHTPEHGQN